MTIMQAIFNHMSPTALGFVLALSIDIHEAEALTCLVLN